MLHGHERAITKIKYNREGDLLFSSSKDKKPNVWYSLNGERLGSFNGHNGSVWCIDVNWDTTRFLSGSGDNSLRVWDCETGLYFAVIGFVNLQIKHELKFLLYTSLFIGKEIGLLHTNSSVRTCNFSYSANLAVYSTDKALGHQCEMFIIDIRNVDAELSQEDAISRIAVTGPRISAILWGALDETIITGHEDGEIALWDVRVSNALVHFGVKIMHWI